MAEKMRFSQGRSSLRSMKERFLNIDKQNKLDELWTREKHQTSRAEKKNTGQKEKNG